MVTRSCLNVFLKGLFITIDMLLLEMIKRISYAVILGLVISRLKLFDRLMINKLSRFDRIIFTVIFPASPSSAPTAAFRFRTRLPTPA